MKRMKYLSIILIVFMSVNVFGQETWINIIAPESINEIKAIGEQYYCATNGGVVVLNTDGEIVERINVADGLPSQLIEDIEIDMEGALFIGTYDNGIAIRENAAWRKIEMPEPLASNNVNFLYCMEFDDEDVLHIGTSDGAYKYVDENWELIYPSAVWDMELGNDGVMYLASHFPIRYEDGNIYEYENDSVFSYGHATVEVTDTRIFWGTDIGYIAEIEGDEWTFYSDTDFDVPPTNFVHNVKMLDNGEVFASFDNGRIYKLEDGAWTSLYQEDTYEKVSLFETDDNEVIFGINEKLYLLSDDIEVFADLAQPFPSNNTEIVSNEYGQILLKSGVDVFKYDGFDLTPTKLTSPVDDSFLRLEFLEFPDKTIGYLDEESGTVYHNNEVINIYDPGVLFDDYIHVRGTLVDSYGGFWIATLNGLIYNQDGVITLFDHTNTPFEITTPNSEGPSFWKVAEDRNGNIWVSSSNAAGRWNRSTGEWEYYHQDDTDYMSGSLSNKMYIDEDNVLWGCGWYSGLIRFDGESWSRIDEINSDLPSNQVTDIFPWNEELVLATHKGLTFFDGINFEIFTTDNSGLGSNVCQSIKEDSQGNLWINGLVYGPSGYGGISIYKTEGVALGISSVAEAVDGDIAVYPNPTSDIFTLDVSSLTYEVKEIQLIDFSGKMVKRQIPIGQTFQLSLNDDLQSGMYLLRVLCEEGVFSRKIILK